MNASLQRLEQGKLYYSISEVCRMTGLEPHVLRYWETEFAQMRPKKNRAGNRAYRTKEIQYVQYIRHLLHGEKYTIQGAKKKLVDVTPEEVSGQLSLLRPEMMPPNGNGFKENSDAFSNSANFTELRKELASIRDGLREVLRLLGGAAK
jgi:DNA-binding transcriptional MerR regulator